MKLVSTMFSTVIEICEGEVFSLVIENQRLFKNYLTDLYKQVAGEEGQIILSKNEKPISIKKTVEIIKDFTPFEINKKSLLSHIYSAIEKKAIDEENYQKTSKLLNDVEKYFFEMSFDLPFSIGGKRLDSGSLIKATQLEIINDYHNDIEAIIDYMLGILTFEKEKLFVFVDLRSYFDDDEFKSFVETISLKQICVLLIESSVHNRVEGLKQLIVDKDLCEI